MNQSPKLLRKPISPSSAKQVSPSRRMSLGNVATVPPKLNVNNSKMFEQLFIFGASPDSNNSSGNMPVLLSMFPSTNYPQTDSDIDSLIQHCFPNPFTPIPENLPPNQVILNEFVFFVDQLNNNTNNNTNNNNNNNNSDNNNNNINNNHTLNGRQYCVCIQFRAPTDFAPFFSSNFSRHYPFAICIISNTFYLTSHFQFGTYLALVLAGKASTDQYNRSGTQRVPLSLRGFCHPTLTLDKKSPSIAVFPGFSAPIALTDILSKYAGRPTEPANDPFFDSNYTDKVPLVIPLNLSMLQCIAYPAFDTLFSIFAPTDIVKIYSAMLLEKQIAFVASNGDTHKSSLCVVACMSLLRPFKIFAKILPVLKVNDSSSFEGPVIFGTSKQVSVDVVCDICTATIAFATSLPAFPKNSEIIRKIELVIQNRIKEVVVPQSETRSFFGRPSPNPEYDSFFEKVEPFVFPAYYTYQFPQKYIFQTALIDSIREIFAGHFAFELNDKIRTSCVKDPDTQKETLNKDMLLQQFPVSDRPFFVQFTQTKIFADFFERAQKQSTKKTMALTRSSTYTSYNRYNMIKSPTKALSPFVNDDDSD